MNIFNYWTYINVITFVSIETQFPSKPSRAKNIQFIGGNQRGSVTSMRNNKFHNVPSGVSLTLIGRFERNRQCPRKRRKQAQRETEICQLPSWRKFLRKVQISSLCGVEKNFSISRFSRTDQFWELYQKRRNVRALWQDSDINIFYKIKVFKKKFIRYNYHYNIELLRKLEKDIRKYSTMLHHPCLLNRSFILRHLFKFIGRLERRVKGHWPFITRLSTRPREADFLVRGP